MARLTYEQRWKRLLAYMRKKRAMWDAAKFERWNRGSFWALDNAIREARHLSRLSRPKPRKEKKR